jgi:HAD superfamily hydrolase (TIGR01509 family)
MKRRRDSRGSGARSLSVRIPARDYRSSGSEVAFGSGVHLRGILLDIDGTLVDSNDIHARCWMEAFRKFGKTFDHDLVRHQIGKGGDLLVPDLLSGREMRKFGDQLREYRGRLFREKYMKSVKPFPGVVDALGRLHRRGIALALASSADEEEVEYYVQLLGVEDIVATTTSKGDAEHSKPSPEIFEAALERLGTGAAHTLVVGDTPYDVLAAHRASLSIAAVLSGGFERGLLSKAEFLFAGVEELEEKIDSIDDYYRQE